MICKNRPEWNLLPPFLVCFAVFGTHFLYVEGYGEGGKVHRVLVFVEVAEPPAVHMELIFNDICR